MARQKRKKENCHFFTNLAPNICHMKNIFMEKKLYILLALHNIYQKQKTESVYLLKNNYDPFSETHIFQKILNSNNKNDDISKYMPPF